MSDRLGPEPALSWFGVVFDEARQVRCLARDLAGVDMVGVRVFPAVGEDGARAVLPNLTDHPGAGVFSQPYVTVREFQIIANGEPHLFGGSGCFGCADLSGSASARLSPRHI